MRGFFIFLCGALGLTAALFIQGYLATHRALGSGMEGFIKFLLVAGIAYAVVSLLAFCTAVVLTIYCLRKQSFARVRGVFWLFLFMIAILLLPLNDSLVKRELWFFGIKPEHVEMMKKMAIAMPEMQSRLKQLAEERVKQYAAYRKLFESPQRVQGTDKEGALILSKVLKVDVHCPAGARIGSLKAYKQYVQEKVNGKEVRVDIPPQRKYAMINRFENGVEKITTLVAQEIWLGDIPLSRKRCEPVKGAEK